MWTTRSSSRDPEKSGWWVTRSVILQEAPEKDRSKFFTTVDVSGRSDLDPVGESDRHMLTLKIYPITKGQMQRGNTTADVSGRSALDPDGENARHTF